MNDKYSIDDVSKFLNIPKSTLRYYDSIDLCRPALRDPKTSYRYYEYNQLFLLSMIEKLKKLRLSLDQIKSHSQIKNISSLEKLLLERRDIIRQELDALLEIHRQNEELIHKIEQSKSLRLAPDITIQQLPDRYLYRLNLNFPIDDLYACIKILYSSYIRNIHNGPALEKGEIALEISKDNLSKKQFGTYNAIGFFVNNAEAQGTELLSKISGGSYVTACHSGSYSTLVKTYKKLYEYIEKSGAVIAGNSIETSIINIAMTNHPNEFVTEIQIPVKEKED